MKYILFVQGLYFLGSSIWPLVDIESFMLVTGPKEDIWLVKIVSGLILTMGLTFLVEAINKEIHLSVILLAFVSSLILTYADIYYSFNNTIKSIYLLDAFIELVFMTCIIFVLLKQILVNKRTKNEKAPHKAEPLNI